MGVLKVAQLGKSLGWLLSPDPMALHPQGQLAAPAAEGGVRGAAHPRPGAGNLAAPLAAGAAPPAGPVGPAEGPEPQPGQPLRGEASGWWAWETRPWSLG